MQSEYEVGERYVSQWSQRPPKLPRQPRGVVGVHGRRGPVPGRKGLPRGPGQKAKWGRIGFRNPEEAGPRDDGQQMKRGEA